MSKVMGEGGILQEFHMSKKHEVNRKPTKFGNFGLSFFLIQ